MVGGDDDVASQRNLEASPKGETVDRRNQGFVDIEAARDAGKAAARRLHPFQRILRRELQVIAGGKGLLPCAGDDRDPEVVVGGEVVPDVHHLVAAGRMDRVVHFRPVDRDVSHVTAFFVL